MICAICKARCAAGAAPWHFVCTDCGCEFGALEPSINGARAEIDETARAEGLRAVRLRAYRRILESIDDGQEGGGGRLLEVGSAHGWFLEAAAPYFDEVIGIEPDDSVRRSPRAGIAVRSGYFPEAVGAGERFDAIVFNDVFEHIPDCNQAARAIAAHLTDSGVAVLTLPVRSGFFYRLANALLRIRIERPFERLWQCGYPSPHLYYFSREGLTRLFASAGMPLQWSRPVPAIALDGLWQRIRYGERSTLVAAAAYAAALALLPFLHLLPADTVTFVFRKGPSDSAGRGDSSARA